jgi:major membrane immunogen (membrane-anchored lipoprotein)
MKKVKTVLIAVVIGLVYSCSKSDFVEPMSLDDGPHKKDTTINNPIPRIALKN